MSLSGLQRLDVGRNPPLIVSVDLTSGRPFSIIHREAEMATVPIEARVSLEALLKAVEQLSTSELEQFVVRVVALRGRRKAPGLSEEETDLLLNINRGLPQDLQARYDALVDRRRAEKLTAEEHDELVRLTDQVEQLEAERLRSLAELARLRETSLPALMKQLGIEPPPYA